MSAARWVLGSELSRDQQRAVLDRYIYRMTTEARQRWPEATRRMLRGDYRMPERSDAEWLAQTRFAVRADGALDERVRYCETSYARSEP